MKIEVKNFGKIKKGQIDLDKKVTVFVGYNNSGKTYMSQLLWALNNNSVTKRLDFARNNYNFRDILQGNSAVITSQTIAQIVEQYKDYIKNTILPELFNVNQEYFSSENFSVAFDENFNEKIRKSPFRHFSFNIDTQTDNGLLEYYLFEKEADSFSITIEKIKLVTPLSVNDIVKGDFDNIDIYKTSEPLEKIFIPAILEMTILLLFDEDYSTFFLPANRVFYPSFYKYIYSIAKDEKDLIDNRLKKSGDFSSLKALSKRPYTKAVDSLIQRMYELNSDAKIKNYYSDLLDELTKIIGGDIVIKSSEGIAPIEFYLKVDDGKDLDMYMSSSSANQLTTLYLYLKYWAEEKDNFLIIDEPEENLHPENQIKLVNILMKFADRNNNKVLITTHSPLITDHINNYANLSYLNEAGVDMATAVENSASHMSDIKNIKHSDYGVYFFSGDSIKEYEVNDYGAYFKDFQAAEDKVKSISDILKENIYNNINEHARKSFQKK